MAYITLDRKKLKHNYQFLDKLFKDNGIAWAAVTKLLCGTERYMEEVVKLGAKEICDARVSNLALIKRLNPDIQTVYIKPPAKEAIPDVIKYANVSFNTELETIHWLNAEAKKQDKIHKIIIMIEMGDLREGVMGEDLIDFYAEIFKLSNISISGIGTNLNCLYGVMPSEDKLVQLALYKQLIEARFNKKIPWVTGGTSVVLPLLTRHQVPNGINHFRVGETLFFGNNLFDDSAVEGMEQSLFKLYAQIIEITEKPKVPSGYLQSNPSGEEHKINEKDYGQTAYRAIVDLGVLDVSDTSFLIPDDPHVAFTGASSDMLVLDLGKSDWDYKVGDLVSFDLKYMGALRLLNSYYIDKRFTD